ncbi:MAG: methionine biosynthesis protein MetW [Pseudomonadota bacterium]
MSNLSELTPKPARDRSDLMVICDLVEPDTKVLDVGCGNGELLELLANRKNVDARGVEISQEGVNRCVMKGLSVVQGDADTDLETYPDKAFDYVIMSHTIQATDRPRDVLRQMMRIGKRAIVSFPNFAHWLVRFQIGIKGHMPITETLPIPWYETPNVHFCSIRDFDALVTELGADVERKIGFDSRGRRLEGPGAGFLANLRAERAVFVLEKP